jgi:hypothetical protein
VFVFVPPLVVALAPLVGPPNASVMTTLVVVAPLVFAPVSAAATRWLTRSL